MNKKRFLAAGDFKQTCLAVLDEVAEQHARYVITKRGRPVAEIVPVEDGRAREEKILQSLRGQGQQLVSDTDLLRPLTDKAGWKLDG